MSSSGAADAPDPVRALSFGSVAANYDAYRPAVPASFLSAIGFAPGMRVLEIAAGTGLATRTLLAGGIEVIAVEPDPDMRRVLTRRSPTLDVRDGVAEHLPIDDASVDAILAMSSWHWFDVERTLSECARVVRDNGRLVAGWNGADQQIDWVADLFRHREPSGELSPSSDNTPAPSLVTSGHDFRLIKEGRVEWSWHRTVDDIAGLFGTYSGVITATPETRTSILHTVREIARRHTNPDGTVTLPMQTRYWIAQRRPREVTEHASH